MRVLKYFFSEKARTFVQAVSDLSQLSVTEFKELVCWYVQGVSNLKDYIQRSPGSCDFNVTDMGAVNAYHFCELFLRQFTHSAVVGDI